MKLLPVEQIGIHFLKDFFFQPSDSAETTLEGAETIFEFNSYNEFKWDLGSGTCRRI